jgi:hypothetical protein
MGARGNETLQLRNHRTAWAKDDARRLSFNQATSDFLGHGFHAMPIDLGSPATRSSRSDSVRQDACAAWTRTDVKKVKRRGFNFELCNHESNDTLESCRQDRTHAD